MKKLYKYCKEDLKELGELLSDPDSGHGVPEILDISDSCTCGIIDTETGEFYLARTVFFNGETTHFTETLYQQLLAHGVISLAK